MFSSNTSQVSDDKLFVEDCFSCFLYQGNGSTQTITNGIDLAGKGGLVWMKDRAATWSHWLFDTARGQNGLSTNATSAQTSTAFFQSFNSNGFTLNGASQFNVSGNATASWTFRKAPKFFDVVTYTGDGTSDPSRSISHNLGVKPGVIIVKATSTTGDWLTIALNGSNYSRSSAATNFALNSTNAATGSLFGGTSYLSATDFQLGAIVPDIDTTPTQRDKVNANGVTYVAYLFAHDTTSDGIIQCGLFSGDGTGSSAANALGWEPQALLIKRIDSTGDWQFFDSMRGFSVGATANNLPAQVLYPNLTSAEVSVTNQFGPTAKGFLDAGYGAPYQAVYIAIRRGPMRTPTLGTTVFSPIANTGNSTAKTLTTNFVTDLTVSQGRNAGSGSRATWWDRLRGPLLGVQSWTSAAEASYTATLTGFDNNTGVAVGADGTYGYINLSPDTFATWHFRRAPSFFDEVCYTGTGSTRTINHNLGVAPELMIVKRRNGIGDWVVYAAPLGATKNLYLEAANGVFTNPFWNDTTPTSSVFTIGGGFASTNASGSTYIAYLFASCPGVSKVGSYTGNGSSQTINCGFAAGARFVMIKRTDSTGDWYCWDVARGIIAGNDPHLSLNTTAAEVTTDDSVDTDSSGFVVNQVSATNINFNAATYLFMAVA